MLNYTEEQQHIINADLNGAKYYRILAVAGSGKTETITSLVAQAINSRQFMPHRVLMVTFTKAAAVTMRERLACRQLAGLAHGEDCAGSADPDLQDESPRGGNPNT